MKLVVEQAEPFPFDLPPDIEAQKNALTMALTIAQGFTLYFVVSDPAHVRPKLMDEIGGRLPKKKIQRIAITTETSNLLHSLQEQLEDPLPDAVFIYGLENWISGSVNPRSIPFILNLNAARNNFYPLVNCPLVLWVPAFVFSAIAEGAPDFFSVRSGAYTFPLSEGERRGANTELAKLKQGEVLGLSPQGREARIYEAENLLSEYRHLADNERNPLDEYHLLKSLAGLYHTQGRYKEAELLLNEALKICRTLLPIDNNHITSVLNDMALIYHSQGRYSEAEPMYKEALAIHRHSLPKDNLGLATSLNNLGLLYRAQRRDANAEPLYEEALGIRRLALPEGHPQLACSIHNLASLYSGQNRYGEAEALHKEVLDMLRDSSPQGHPDIAASLNNLANLYKDQGRYGEAEQLYSEALEMLRWFLPEDHPDIAISTGNLANVYKHQGRYKEAELLYAKAIDRMTSMLGSDHPLTEILRQNIATLQKRKSKHASTISLAGVTIVSEKGKGEKPAFHNQLKPMVLPKSKRQKKKSR